MPSSRKAIDAILALLPPQKGTIFELGSGWGSLVFPVARKAPQSLIKAFEVSPVPFYISKVRAKFHSFCNLQIKRRDFFHTSLHEADIIVCYLYPDAMLRLKSKFEIELRVGTLIISNCFAIPGWKAEKVIELQDLWRTKVYLYRKHS